MNITSAREASKRFHTNAANAHKEENKKRLQNLTNLQAMCPTTEIKEITSSSDTIRTVEKQKLFNGPWLLEDPPENIAPATITVWMLTKGTPKPHGPSKTDQTGMLDTARQTLWADMQASAPQPDKEPEAELFRRAKAWNTHANPPKMDNATQETTTTITPQPPKSPLNTREHFPKRRRNQQDPLHTQQPAKNSLSGTNGRPRHTNKSREQTRHTKSNTLLAHFNHAPRTFIISKHLCMADDLADLAQANDKLSKTQPGNRTYRRLLQHRNHLNQITEVDSILATKAQNLDLVTIKVIGDGNCLQYAVNASHKEQTNHYLANNDDLRLLATALARAHARKQKDQPKDLIDTELKMIEQTAQNGFYHYPGTYMNALATIRHGPVIIISDTLGEDPTTYLPLKEMTDILHGNPTTHPSPHAPYLPPIYILNRTTINPPHFDASKPAPRIETQKTQTDSPSS